MNLSLKSISLLIAVGTPLLIAIGVISSTYYYTAFDIRILDFIDLSEAIVLFFKYAFATLFILALVFSINIILYPEMRLILKSNKELESILGHNSLNKKTQRILLIWTVVILFFCYPLKISEFGFFWYQCFTIIRFALMIWYGYYCFGLYSAYVNFIRISILLILFGFVLAYTAMDINLSYKSTIKKTIVLNDKTLIQSGKDTIFVGKTKSYYFFYLKRSNGTYILNAENVVSVLTSK